MKLWKGIDEFLAVAECGSFSKAAERLGTAVSNISKQVTTLEGNLGVKLFTRSTRNVQLTSQGQLLYHASYKVLSEFQQLQDTLELNQKHLTGQLRLCSVGGSRPAFQMDLYHAFLEEYPGLTLDIMFKDEMPDLQQHQIDLALVVDDVDANAYENQYLLCWVDYTLIASPKLMATRDLPAEPADLAHLPCILNGSNSWRLNNGKTSQCVEVSGHFSSLNMPACVDACLSGLGVFMAPAYSADSLLASGRAIRLLPDWQIRKAMYAVTRDNEYIPAKVTLLLEFLHNIMGTDTGDSGNFLRTAIPATQGTAELLHVINTNARKAGDSMRKERKERQNK